MVDTYFRECAPRRRLRSIVNPIAQKSVQPGDLGSQAIVHNLLNARPDETDGTPRAFLSRFVVLQAIGAAGIVGLWVAGIADKPFAGNNGFLCWLITAIGALGIACVFLQRWRDVDMTGSPEPRAYVLPWSQSAAQQLQDATGKADADGTGVEMAMPSDGGLDTREPMFYAQPQPALPVKDYHSGARPLVYAQPGPEADATP